MLLLFLRELKLSNVVGRNRKTEIQKIVPVTSKKSLELVNAPGYLFISK